jgi:signal transduction histidine kinase
MPLVMGPTPDAAPLGGRLGASSEEAGRARVLVVDDDRVLVRVLSDALSQRLEGVEVEACAFPMAAIERIEAGDVDVVVSDLVMAGLHGFELLERVKAIRPTSMVVLITGADDRDLSVRALRGGAYDFIQKPVDPDYLAACIRRAVETRRLRAAVERQQEALRRHAEELERTVAERTEELRRASRTKDEFLATVSHELRTPLTAILGWARLLCGGRLDASEQAQAIESIARNAKSQAQLIDDLLDVSRIITGKLRLDVRPVDLFRVLEGALGVVGPAAQAKDIKVETWTDEAVGAIQGDPHRLQQVFWNLLSNAVKFTPPGGHVAVRLVRCGEQVEVVVQDDGDGIEVDFLPHVFDRFRQGESHLSSRRGLGLGLAITQNLVELHGGRVTAHSAGPGTGATFTVVLPCPTQKPGDPIRKRRPSPSPMEVGRAPEACLRGVRVLVIDDDADTRQVLRLMLEHAGASVGLASSVAEAHEAFRETRPDVLLCDIGLGSDDGYALLRALRALPKELGGGVPAVALTGYAKPEDRVRALVAGFDLHVAKPGPADLPAVLAGLLQRGDLE